MELMIVVVIIGIVAAFAIPNYSKAVDKAVGQDALNNLRILMSAEVGYAAQNPGVYYPDGLWIANTAELNTVFHLNIIQQKGLVYSCQTIMIMNSVTCRAILPGKWSMQGYLPTGFPMAGVSIAPGYVCNPIGGNQCPQVK